MGIILWIIIGFFAGLIARAVVPGRQHMGLLATTLLGIVGSLIGGLAGTALWGRGQGQGGFSPGGLVLSIVGAIVVLLVLGLVRRRPAATRA